MTTLHFDTRNSPIETFVSWRDRGDLNLDAAYQRGSVWGPDRQRNLIRSLIIGLPIGAIFINERGITEPFVIIDGKQRIEAILEWYDGELAVPADWFDRDQVKHTYDDGQVTYGDLTPRGQRLFSNGAAIATYLSHFSGANAEAKERELFDLVNYGGVPQGERDPQPVTPVVA